MSELTTISATPPQAISPFSGGDAFKAAREMALLLSESSMLPAPYQGPKGVGNCLIALELASRMGVSVFTITQNMDVIHGRPAFKATYIIGSINSSGRFSPLRFEYSGTPGTDARSCRCVATDKATGEVLEGTVVSIKMAKAEGWYSRSASKWPNMPDQMLSYRAGCFWQRLHCPQVTLGLQSKEEVEDYVDVETVQDTPKVRKRTTTEPAPALATETTTTPAPDVIQEAVEVVAAPAPETQPAPVVESDPLAALRADVSAKFAAADIKWKDVKKLAVESEWWVDADMLKFAQLPKEALEFLSTRVDRIKRQLARLSDGAPDPTATPAQEPQAPSDQSPI